MSLPDPKTSCIVCIQPDAFPTAPSECVYCGTITNLYPRQCCDEGRRFDELYELCRPFEGAMNTATTRAQLQSAIENWVRGEFYRGFDYVALSGAMVDSLREVFPFFAEADWMISERQFTEVAGHAPANDDLERANCDKAGQIGHWSCGWCEQCNRPRYQCGHFLMLPALESPDQPERYGAGGGTPTNAPAIGGNGKPADQP